MTEVPRPVPGAVDDFTDIFEFERLDAAESRLIKARDEHPLAYALAMAALSWDRVKGRGWRTPSALCIQAGRLAAVGRVPAVSVEDVDAVASALAWATQEPAVLECDSQGRYRPGFVAALPVGSLHWLARHREAALSGVLTPLELVEKGDSAYYGTPMDLAAAEASYRLAAASDDAEAAALASLRLAELAEERDQPAEAADRYAAVAEQTHTVAWPTAALRLAQYSARDGDQSTARALAHQVIANGDPAVLQEAWNLLASLAWLEDDQDAAVAALRQAVETAGPWHPPYTRRLVRMLAACGDVSGAADACRTLLDDLLSHDTDPGDYVQLMAAAGRMDEAVAVLEEHAAQDGIFTGHILLALVTAHAARDDMAAAWQALARVRAHPTACLPDISVQADVREAALATADGDDERAAKLYRSLTDSDDMLRRDLARPLLIAAGDHIAAEQKICLIPGTRPLLEFLSEAASPATAAWAASSLAHLAVVEGRPHDMEAAVHLAARHLSIDEMTVLLARLRHRASRAGHDELGPH
jgi:FimV-like protein